ncbi:MAG: hypothetical protein M0036_10360 [Desulfobacteraceae bacterium]|nr:hypothetical protein [Desulfobacteraceae bacterium]
MVFTLDFTYECAYEYDLASLAAINGDTADINWLSPLSLALGL